MTNRQHWKLPSFQETDAILTEATKRTLEHTNTTLLKDSGYITLPTIDIRYRQSCTDCVFMYYTDPQGTSFKCAIDKDTNAPCHYNFTKSEIIGIIDTH